MASPTAKRSAERHLNRVFSALANGTRRRLLLRLAAGPACIGELAGPFAMTLPAVSSHIRVLEQAGLLRRERDGRFHRCALDPTPLRDASDFVERYRGFWEDTLEALARYTEQGEQGGQQEPAEPQASERHD